MKVLTITNSGTGGDLPPVIAVAEGLHKRGHNVLVCGDSDLAATMRASGVPISTVPVKHHWGRYRDTWRQRLITEGREKAGRFPLPDWTEARYPYVRDICSQFVPDVLVSQLFQVQVTYRLSAETGVPWCFINPTYYFGKYSVRSTEEDFDELPGELHKEYWWPMIEQASLVLHSTDPEFDFRPPEIEDNHYYVGPLFWEPPANRLTYLDDPGPPWVLATLSSELMPDEMRLGTSILNALEQQPVRAVLTMSSAHQSEIVSMSANVRIAEYVPHSQVLKKSRLFISHAGHNSVMKALYYGVPMVLVPWGRDQLGVGARAEKLGVAKIVKREELSQESLRSAIEEVLREPQYLEQSQKVSRRLQSQDWVALACRYIEEHF